MAGPGACRTYSIPEMIQLARNAGFTGLGLITIVAIAVAESGGQSCAVNPSGATGILQFMPQTAAGVGLSDARDAQAAFQAAYRLSHQGSSFHDWTTYTTGAFQQFAGAVQGQLGAVAGPSSSSSGFQGVADAISGAAGRTLGSARGAGMQVQSGVQVLAGLLVIAAGAGVLLYLLLTRTDVGRGAMRVGRDTGKAIGDVAAAAIALAPK